MSFTSLRLLAGSGLSPIVHDLGLCLLGAALLAVVFERVRFPTIAALLAAGVLIGPIGLELVKDHKNVETIANLGLTLLLFVIGLEVNLRALLGSGKALLLPGLLQVPLALTVGYACFLGLARLGWPALTGPYTAVYLALGCTLSSTLLVVKLFQAALQLDTVSGRMAIGLLIFQDIWAMIFLAVQPNLESPELGPIVLNFVAIGIVGLFASVVARFLLPRAFEIVGRNPEMVVTVALGWCFGVGLFGAHLGAIFHALGIPVDLSVSMEMSALIAGASIASFPYAYEVVGRVVHIRDFFVTLFFVGLGMSIPAPNSIQVVIAAMLLALVAIALRWIVFLPLLYVVQREPRIAFETSTKLAQISEFCLVIAYLGLKFGHLTETHVSVVIFAFILTALLTPWLFRSSETRFDRIRPVLAAMGMRGPTTSVPVDESSSAPPRLVLLGFHRVASALVHELERTYPALLGRTIVVDSNVTLHDAIRKHGIEVVYGNAANVETLRHARVHEAEVILSTVPEELLKETTTVKLVRAVREVNPRAVLLVVASKPSMVSDLEAAGANHCIVLASEAAEGLLAATYAALNDGLTSFVATKTQRHGHPSLRREILG
ncbi:MAG: cation:proton antiporter [Polyangiaceae bacterium]